jgi:hypothetical protein
MDHNRYCPQLINLILKGRTLILWLFWFGQLLVWFATLFSLSAVGQYTPWLDAAAIILLLYVLFFAEGLELAIADLLDKEAEQLNDTRLRALLSEIQRRKDFFFSTRQVFVVLIITFMSLRTIYPWIMIPFLGRVSAYNLPFWFSLCFTSLTVLWFCQVTPKRLAVMNSELFLRQSAFLWPLIKLIGVLGLPSPSDQLIRLFGRFTLYRKARHLRPSPAAHYNATCHTYGLSTDRIHVAIDVNTNGATTIRKRFAVLFLHGKRTHHTERLYCNTAIIGVPKINVIGLFVGPTPERLELIQDDLDTIFAEGSCQNAGRFRKIDDWRYYADSKVESDVFLGGHWANWTVWSDRPLPEAFWHHTDQSNQLDTPLALLIYEIELTTSNVALFNHLNERSFERVWPEYISAPCRALTFQVSTSMGEAIGLQGCDVHLHPGNIPVLEETLRCTQIAVSTSKGLLCFKYPIQAAVYTTRWWNLPSLDQVFAVDGLAPPTVPNVDMPTMINPMEWRRHPIPGESEGDVPTSPSKSESAAPTKGPSQLN